MIPGQKNSMYRYTFIVFLMTLVAIAVIVKAGIIMFGERQYWTDVADRYIKENVVVHPTRGNIISADNKLMASSLPEYKIFMDFVAVRESGRDSVLMDSLTKICEGLHQIFPNKSAQEFRRHILKGRRLKSRNYLLYPKRISYIEYKEVKKLPVFNLNKYKGGFHELAYNQRKKPFGSLAARTLGDMFPDMTLGAKNGLELTYDSILRGKDGITHRLLILCHFIRNRRTFIERLPGYRKSVPQFIGHILVHLVFQKLFHQLCSRIFFLALFIDLTGKQHPTLDVQKCCRHQQKFAHDVHVFRLHLTDIIQILFRDFHDRNIVNIDFIFFNQM